MNVERFLRSPVASWRLLGNRGKRFFSHLSDVQQEQTEIYRTFTLGSPVLHHFGIHWDG